MADLTDIMAEAIIVAIAESTLVAKRETGDKDPRYKGFVRRERAEIVLRELRRNGVKVELEGS